MGARKVGKKRKTERANAYSAYSLTMCLRYNHTESAGNHSATLELKRYTIKQPQKVIPL